MIFSSKKITKYIFTLGFLCTLSTTAIVKSEISDQNYRVNKEINSEYLSSKKELKNYIIDKGDNLFIKFYPAEELSGFYSTNEEGEIFLPRLEETNVKGLTTSELEKFLEEKYSKFLISPNIKVKIAIFREVDITVSGEVRYPGIYKFPAYKSSSIRDFQKDLKLNKVSSIPELELDSQLPELDSQLTENKTQNQLVERFSVKDKNNLFINYLEKNGKGKTTIISDVIRKAGGITSLSDLENIQVIRHIPIGKGGGKKVANINLNTILNTSDTSNDIRLFDGDRIFIPTLSKPSEVQVPKSVLTGLSPRFVQVNVFGRVKTSGKFMLPLEGTLSDAIDITGPIKPLSGKVVLIRYNRDGTIGKKKIAYSANAPRGSKRNPFIKEGDLINVTNSVFGKTTDVLREITSPFIGIYTAKELIEDFSD